MKGLTAVAPPYIDRYRLVVCGKKDAEVKARLETVDANVATRYKAFEAAVSSSSIRTLPENPALQAMADDLRSCYAIRTKNLGTILKAIKSAQPKRLLEKCPYCGITLPTTHDHYLPASKYPELAVHGLNLVPCCSSCNETKGNRWKDTQQRWFIHFYSDPIPDAQFLCVTLVPSPAADAIGARFEIRCPSTTPAHVWATIENHFTKLNLLERYSEFVNEEIASALDACVDHVCDGGHNATNFLIRTASRLDAVFGTNHWRVVLCRALAGSHVFLDMVASKVGRENES
jgi:5-methylcytosine-specific restriction endonuclease McrA